MCWVVWGHGYMFMAGVYNNIIGAAVMVRGNFKEKIISYI